MIDVMAAKEYVAVYLEKELKQQFKSLCVFEDRDMSDVAAELIADWVSKKNKKKSK